MNVVTIKTPFENDPFVHLPLEEGESFATEVDEQGGLIVYSRPQGAIAPGSALIRFAAGSWNYVLSETLLESEND